MTWHLDNEAGEGWAVEGLLSVSHTLYSGAYVYIWGVRPLNPHKPLALTNKQSDTQSPRVSPHPLSDHWSAIEPPTKSMEEIIQSLQNHAYIKNMYQNPCLPYSCVN